MNHIVENRRFKSRDQICNVRECNSLLVDFKCTKLKNAIQKVWIKYIQEVHIHPDNNIQMNDNDCYEIKSHETIKLYEMTSKEFYSILCSFKKSDLAVLLSWEEKFDVTVDFNWKNVLEFKLKTLKNTKVKQCNFKTIHRILPYRL